MLGLNTPGNLFGFLPKEEIQERPTLTPEEAQRLANHKVPQFTFTLTEDDILKAKCNHQGNPLHPNNPAFSRTQNGQLVCNTCGEIINVDKVYTAEEVEAIFHTMNDIMNLLKITDRTLPDEVRAQLYQATALFKKIPDIYKHCSSNFDKIYNSNFVNYSYNGFNDVFGTINSMYTNTGMMSPMGQMNPYGNPAAYGYGQPQPMQGQPMNYGFNPQPTQPVAPQPMQGQPMNYGFNPQPVQPVAPQPMNYGYVGQAPVGTNLLDPTSNVYTVQQPTQPGMAPTLEPSTNNIPGAGIGVNVAPSIPELDPNTGKPKTV